MADGKKGSGSKTTSKTKQKQTKSKLTPRDRKFVDLVVEGVPKSRAYVQAGFKDTPNARQNAYNKLTKSYMQETLEERWAEAERIAGIKKEHAIGRLVQIGFGDVQDVTDESGYFDFERAKDNGATHLLRKVSRTPTMFGEKVAYELHDPIGALRTLGKWCGWEKAPEINESSAQRVASALYRRLQEELGWPAEAARAYVESRYEDVKLLTDGGAANG